MIRQGRHALAGLAAGVADAILLGAVTSDHPDLLAAVARIAADRPVIGLVNALDAPELAHGAVLHVGEPSAHAPGRARSSALKQARASSSTSA